MASELIVGSVAISDTLIASCTASIIARRHMQTFIGNRRGDGSSEQWLAVVSMAILYSNSFGLTSDNIRYQREHQHLFTHTASSLTTQNIHPHRLFQVTKVRLDPPAAAVELGEIFGGVFLVVQTPSSRRRSTPTGNRTRALQYAATVQVIPARWRRALHATLPLRIRHLRSGCILIRVERA